MDKQTEHHLASPGSHHAHVLPLKVYIGVWLALVFLTVLTVAASFVHIGPFNVPIMLLIAITKGTLVALFFMHLFYDEKFNLLVFLFSLVFVIIFFAGTLTDIATRGTVDFRESSSIAPEMERVGYDKEPIVKEPIRQEHNVEGIEAQTITGGVAHPDAEATPAPEPTAAPGATPAAATTEQP